jgi:hypothetical protein
MTLFCTAVVNILLSQRDADRGMGSYELRTRLMEQGFGKHPAGVAMNLTKLAFKGEYVTQFIHKEERIFMLTAKGRQGPYKP